MTSTGGSGIRHQVTAWSDNEGVHHRRCGCGVEAHDRGMGAVDAAVRSCRDTERRRAEAERVAAGPDPPSVRRGMAGSPGTG